MQNDSALKKLEVGLDSSNVRYDRWQRATTRVARYIGAQNSALVCASQIPIPI